jgi:hypothetical protein
MIRYWILSEVFSAYFLSTMWFFVFTSVYV